MMDNPVTPIEGMEGTLIAQDGNLAVRLMTMRDFWKMVGWLSDERLLEFYEGRDTRWTESDVMLHFFGRPDHEVELLRVVMLLDGEAIGYGQIYRLYGELYDEYHYPDFGDVVYAMDQFIGVPELWDIGIGTRYVRMVVGWLAQKRKAAAVLVDPRKANKRAVRLLPEGWVRNQRRPSRPRAARRQVRRLLSDGVSCARKGLGAD